MKLPPPPRKRPSPPTSPWTVSPSSIRTIRYEIRDIDGTLHAIKERHEFPDGSKRTPWYLPEATKPGLTLPDGTQVKVANLPLYGTERLATAPPDGPVVIVEGEKSAQSLIDTNVTALGTFGASHRPNKTPLKPLQGHPVTLWPDNDEPGLRHMHKLGYDLIEMTDPVYLLTPPENWPKGYDAANFLDEGGDLSALKKYISPAPARPIQYNPDLKKDILPDSTKTWFEATKARLSMHGMAAKYIELSETAGNWKGSCPFPWHADSTPSFWVYPETESWFCFGCDTGGDIIDFAWKMNIDLDKEG